METITLNQAEQSIAVLTLNRPTKKNALSIALREECVEALRGLARSAELKVLILAAAGDVFCAGFDLEEFKRASEDKPFSTALWESADVFFRAVASFPVPTIAAINGPVFGGGFDLVTLCDLRVCSEETTLSHPEANWGRVTYSPLRELVGGAVARDLCLTGRKITAQEAATRGLVSMVVPRAALSNAALELARQVAKPPRETLVAAKSKFLECSGIASQRFLDL